MSITLPETSVQLPPEPSVSPSKPPVPREEEYPNVGSGSLRGKVAIVTGANNGIGRSVAILFAKEGADVCIVYHNEHAEADETMLRIEEQERRTIKFAGDLAEPAFCEEVVQRTMNAFGRIDILVNYAGEPHELKGVADLEPLHVAKIFGAHLFGFFYLTRAVLPHLKAGAAIINTISIHAHDPSPQQMAYACAQAAALSFTRSLAKQLVERRIRVNAVAPGPVWAPLAPASTSADAPRATGAPALVNQSGQSAEVVPAFLLLATESDSAWITGQVLHVDDGAGLLG